MAQKGLIDQNLQALLLHLRDLKEANAEARSRGGQVTHLRPTVEHWDGDLASKTGWINLHKAFNTDMAETALIDAHTADDPGNSGDDIALTLQLDYAAQMERAYRARATMPFPRMLAHVTGRERGHANQRGVLAYGLLRYVDSILKQAGSAEGGSI